MLKYLIVQISDASASFCHYTASSDSERVISLSDLQSALVFAMKENLQLTFLMPDRALPEAIEEEALRYNAIIIASNSSVYAPNASIVVYQSVDSYNSSAPSSKKVDLITLPISDISTLESIDITRLKDSLRLNVALQGIERTQYEDGFSCYKKAILSLSTKLESIYLNGGDTQVNLLTDILFADGMTNCNAGMSSITVAPNGRYYLCPAFYSDNPNNSIGSIASGPEIKNPQLLKLDHAPICGLCDAYHCHRCIWLNEQLTRELNTPSRQQCVLSHIERNQSRLLRNHIRQYDPVFADKRDLPKLSYLDPFELLNKSL